MNFITTEIEKDSAQWICNSLYSIMIGLAIATVVRSSDWVQWPSIFSALFLLLVLYYILDWLSFNAIMDARDNPVHVKIFAYVVSIVTLGSLFVFSTELIKADGSFVELSCISVSILVWFLFLYIFMSSAIGYFIFNILDKRKSKTTNNSGGVKEKTSYLYVVVVSSVIGYYLFSNLNREKPETTNTSCGVKEKIHYYLYVDEALRIISAVISAVIITVLITKTPLEIETLVKCLVFIVVLLIIGKALRYEFYLLPKAKQAIKNRKQGQEGGA